MLSLVLRHSKSIQERFPRGIEINKSEKGAFPRIRILDSKASEALLEKVAHDAVCTGQLADVAVWSLPQDIRDRIKRFITIFDKNELNRDMKLITPYLGDEGHSWKALHLIRGLVACGVLQFALKDKRWRVNYGLDTSRTMLAVPYRAKDSPATR